MRRSEWLADAIKEQTDECILWPFSTKGSQGYGLLRFQGKNRYAHRVVFYLETGNWPTETLDHLCRNRACINIRHLEPVSIGQNVLRGEAVSAKNTRKTHCPQGHPYSDSNTGIRTGKNGSRWRYCKKCLVIKSMERTRQRKAAGLCVICKSSAPNFAYYCDFHRAYINKKNIERKARLKAALGI